MVPVGVDSRMPDWDERFREGKGPCFTDPSPILRQYVPNLPDGRALDVATGTGRNAAFLASEGYSVDAIDMSREGLRIARENAVERGLDSKINWIRADVSDYAFPREEYDVITISLYRAIDRFPDIKEALAPGGCLFAENHLRSTDPTEPGPGDDRVRFAANELLQACLDLTVLYYDETMVESPGGGDHSMTRILARNSSGASQSYPRRGPVERDA